MITVKLWPLIHIVSNTICQKLFLSFAILRDMLDIIVLANGAVTIKDNNNSIFVCGQCGSGKTDSTTMLKHYVAYPGGLKRMEKVVQSVVLDSDPILDAMSIELVCLIGFHASLVIKKIMKRYALSLK